MTSKSLSRALLASTILGLCLGLPLPAASNRPASADPAGTVPSPADGTPAPGPGPAGASAKPPPATVAPLFETGIDFEFPDAARIFGEVRTLLLDNYYSGQLSEQALYLAAIRGMLRHVSPPGSPDQARLWTAPEYADVVDSLRGRAHSLGIRSRFDPQDASLTVTAVTTGSPADGALRVHDRIMRINGLALDGRDSGDLDEALNPTSGSVRLTVVRDIEVFEVEIQPAVHEEPVIEASVLPGAVGYLRVKRITAGIAARVQTTVTPWLANGVGRLILDLRDNGGGVFFEGLRLAELFIPKGAVMLLTLRAGAAPQRFVSSNASPIAMRTIVLIDEGTASAAEVVAAALVSNGKARMLGHKSYGKATLEQTFTLSNAMRVRFIVGALYAPVGASWNERGLRPEIEVPVAGTDLKRWLALPISARLEQDVQLRSAWQVLR